MYNKLKLKAGLQTTVEEFCGYMSLKTHLNDQKVIQGEFYTKLRRYLPEVLSGSHALNILNLEKIYFDHITGEIHYIGFITVHYNDQSKYLIDLLNDILEDLNFNFKKELFQSKINNIINLVKYKVITC